MVCTGKKHNERIDFISKHSLGDAVLCVTQCTQVPTVAMDYIDASALKRQISLLRSEMSVVRMESTADWSISLSKYNSIPNIQTVESLVKQISDWNNLGLEYHSDAREPAI